MSEQAHQSWWRAAGSPWVLLLAAPVIGTVYFCVLYLVAEASCSPAVGPARPDGPAHRDHPARPACRWWRWVGTPGERRACAAR